jgi:hypothetical protein
MGFRIYAVYESGLVISPLSNVIVIIIIFIIMFPCRYHHHHIDVSIRGKRKFIWTPDTRTRARTLTGEDNKRSERHA